MENQQITHHQTNTEKADKTTFEANGRLYQVKRIKNLSKDDAIANYPYEDNDKKYCIVLIED